MSEFLTYHFSGCHVRYFPTADYLETVFPDGAKCPAQFSFTPDEWDKAKSLGYDSCRRMHFEHELSHTFISEALGEPYCPVLRSVAVKGPCEGAWDREALVLDWQRFLNMEAPVERLRSAFFGSFALHTARDEFRARFRT